MRGVFIRAEPGLRFCVHHGPEQGHPRGMVLYVHPWGEEMNKARRMAAWQARELCRQGYAVLQIDLLGCGDSSGDFGDASWEAWVSDVLAGVQWLRDMHGQGPLWLWGLRAGALVASEALQRLGDAAANLLLWQPTTAGKSVLQQFLRTRAAAEMHAGDSKGLLQRLRADLAAGRSVEAAGYRVSPALAAGLEAARLLAPPGNGRVVWLEVATRQPPALLPTSASCIAAWRADGKQVQAQALTGPGFWQTQEIEDAPELIATTSAALAAA